MSKTIKEECWYGQIIETMVQHGDVNNSNISISNNNICLIDFDTLGRYPLFYDLLYYITINAQSDSFIIIDDYNIIG